MPDGRKNVRKPLWKTPWVWLLISTVVALVISWIVTPIKEELVARLFPAERTVKFDFQAESGCPNGILTEVRKRVGEEVFQLGNGADNLIICDTESLETTRDQVPVDLAERYPGCLEVQDTSPSVLSVLRLSPHICKIPKESTLICIGVSARKELEGDMQGQGEQPRECTVEEVAAFGFAQ